MISFPIINKAQDNFGNTFFICEDEFVYLGTDASPEQLEDGSIGYFSEKIRVKIGITQNPIQRLKTFRTANPDFNYIHIWYMPGIAKKVESVLHFRFRKSRISNEWFLINTADFLLLRKFIWSDFNYVIENRLPHLKP